MRKAAGFTLLELLTVLLIIGILAAFALSAYGVYVNRAARADAAGALIGLAASLERRFSENGNYCDSADDSAGSAAVSGCSADSGAGSNDTGIPAFYADQSPADSATPFYMLTISAMNAAGTSFTLTATRAGNMTDDDCGDLTLTHTGLKGITNNAAGTGVADCW